MSAIPKLAGSILWMAVFPVLTGLLPCLILPAQKRTISRIVLSGMLLTFGLFECLALPVLLFTPLGEIRLLTGFYAVLMPILSFLGIVFTKKSGGIALTANEGKRKNPIDKQAFFFMTLFFGLLFWEFCMAYTHASFDGDDAYYVTQSVLSWKTNTMYRYLPYTGTTTSLDFRHALAMLPMWTSVISRLSGTHPTILLHSIEPLLFLPLADLSFLECARELFAKEEEGLRCRHTAAFLACVALLQIFGNVSIYTPETFLLTRTWQGKAVFVGVMLPLIFALLLREGRLFRKGKEVAEEDTETGKTEEEAEKHFLWIQMLLAGLSSGLLTSLAPVFTAGLLLFGGALLALGNRSGRIFIRVLFACVPCGAEFLLWFALTR